MYLFTQLSSAFFAFLAYLCPRSLIGVVPYSMVKPEADLNIAFDKLLLGTGMANSHSHATMPGQIPVS